MRKSKFKISALWITRNEELELPRSIKSVRSQVNELIVVDTGSTDSTVELATNLGAKVFHFDWIDDFSAPRNFAIEQAIGDWIIFLDADEYFVYPNKVRRAVEKFAVKDTILIPRINIDPGRDNRELSRDWNARIFRRAPNIRFRGIIHENIACLDRPIEYVFSDERLLTYHTGYRATLIEGKHRRNLRLIELDIKLNGHNVRQDIALIDCYSGLREYDKVIEYARRVLLSNFEWVIGIGNVYHRLLNAMRQLKYPDAEMLPIAEEAIRRLPQLPEFYAERGMILCGLNRWDEAYLELHKSLEVWRNMPPTIHENSYFPNTLGKIYNRLAEFEMLVGNRAGARQNLLKALEYEPGNRQYQYRLTQTEE